MAFVNDPHDSSGQGMFSKAGRYTSEKYMIFQRKDEILYNKKRVMKIGSTPSLGIQGKNENQQSKFNLNKKNELLEKGNAKKEENTQFFKQLSREKFQLVNSVRYPPKPVGYYNPRYTEIDKNKKQIWNILEVYKKKTNPHIVPKPEPNIEQMLKQPIPEKQLRKVKGSIELSKQNDRGDLNQGYNAHEKRFETLQLSLTWTKIPRTPGFNMKKSIGREDEIIYQNKEHQPDYNPNFEYGKKRIGSAGPPIKTLVSRKPFNKISYTTNENFFDFDFYTKQHKSLIFRNVSTPKFKKMLPREFDPTSPLPSFMQKNVCSRQQLGNLHHKMLEQNFFSEGRFQNTNSAFNSSKKHKKPEDEEENDEEVYQEDQDQQNQNYEQK